MPSPALHPSKRTIWYTAVAVCAAYVLLYALALVFRWGGDRGSALVGDIGYVPLLVGAIIFGAVGYGRIDARYYGVSRRWVMAALVLWVVAEATSYGVGGDDTLPLVARPIFLLVYVFGGIGLLKMADPFKPATSSSLRLDLALVLIPTCAWLWVVLVHPMLLAPGSPLFVALNIANIGGDIFLLATAMLLWLVFFGKEDQVPRALVFLVVGLLPFVAGDIAWNVLEAANLASRSNPVNVVWGLGCAIWTLGGVRVLLYGPAELGPTPRRETSRQRAARAESVSATIAFVVAATLFPLLVWRLLGHDHRDALVVVGALAVVCVLVVARMVRLLRRMVRLEAAADLRRSQRTLSSVIEQSPLGTWILDAKGTLRRINEASRQMLGIGAAADVVGKYNVHEDTQFAGQGLAAGFARVLDTGETVRLELSYTPAKGFGTDGPGHGPLVLGVTLFPIKGEYGQVLEVVMQHRDITEERKLEQQLRQVQKMEAVGQLAGGIAHDFNNLLTAMFGHLQFLHDGLRPDDPMQGEIKAVRQTAERAASLTRQLLAFSRRQVLELRVFDANEMVSDMDRMFRRVLGESIAIASRLTAAPLPVKADRAQIEQVLLNLVVNARDAMPNGGHLTIESYVRQVDADYCALQPDLQPGLYAVVAVTDDGVGISPEARAHLFEPFFTTKDVGKGTGLGLAVAFGIVKQHHGTITVYSELGHGTTMRIYLPLAAAVRAPAPVERPGIEGGLETLFIVEDEEVVREIARRILENSGYRILEAKDGVEALEMARKYPGAIDLLLTDVVMPKMGGLALAQGLRDVRPDIGVVLMSGYARDISMDALLAEKNYGFVSKPFPSAALLEQVRLQLDRRNIAEGA